MSHLEDRSIPEELGLEPSAEDMYSPGAFFSKSAQQLIQKMFDESRREVERLEEKYSPVILAGLDEERQSSFDEIYSKVVGREKVDTYHFRLVLGRLRDRGLVMFSSGCHSSLGDRYWLPSYTKDAFRNRTTPPSEL